MEEFYCEEPGEGEVSERRVATVNRVYRVYRVYKVNRVLPG